MIKQMQKTACALAVLATTSLSAMAADSVDVRVIGTITPAACTPTLSGGGTVDYGTMKPDTLSDTAYTLLSEQQLDFAITCDAPAKLALKAINGRPNTLAGGTEGVGGYGVPPITLLGSTVARAAGLGMDGTAKIGGFAVALKGDTVTADGNTVSSLVSSNMGSSWSVGNGGEIGGAAVANNWRSWGATGTTTPVAFTNLAGKISVQAYLNHASELDLTKPVNLDGLTTIELIYL
jgi:type 1 fimbria pilin